MHTFSLKRTESRHNFFICFVSKLLEKSLEMTIVGLFFKKLRGAVSVTVPQMDPTTDIFPESVPKGKVAYFICFV